MGSINISWSHAGGNIKNVEIRQDVVRLEQDVRDSTKWWFYWNFRAESPEAQTIRFEFTNGEVIGPWGPAVSRDGLDWNWLEMDTNVCSSSSSSFQYTFKPNEVVYFAFGLPYQLCHFEHFYARIARYESVKRHLLAITHQLKAIPLLRIGNEQAKRHLYLTCRHHACESTPSYLLEGLLESLLRRSSPILQNCLIHYIPFMDMDGVEDGDQGKNRAPHDHNRDYTANPIYSSVRELMSYTLKWKPEIFIDFHGPFKWGERNDYPFFAKQGSPIKEETEKLSRILEGVTSEPAQTIRFDSSYDVDMGAEWWHQPKSNIASAYFARAGAKLSCTFEFPYFGLNGPSYTPNNCRLFGEDFGLALEAYVKEA
jgi:hypothetical protein